MQTIRSDDENADDACGDADAGCCARFYAQVAWKSAAIYRHCVSLFLNGTVSLDTARSPATPTLSQTPLFSSH